MLCSGKGNNEINRLHERSLRTANNDYESTYEEFLYHNQNIHPLATEIYDVAHDLSVRDFKNLFDFKDKYTLHIFRWLILN